ncbi:MAG TPA: hypothetical protein VNA12_04105, partial [Mycobacteriales bacterium]|nr:hypothetical protein [Mycobacteriales bacterium]
SGLAVAERLGLRSTLVAVVRPMPAAKTAAVPRTGAAPRIALGVVGAPPGARPRPPAAASRDRAADRRTASGLAWLLIAAAATGLVRQGAVDSPRRRALTGGG